MASIQPSPLLKRALLADAVSGAAAAALQLGLAGTLAPLLQLPRALLVDSGVFLAAFVVLLAVLARQARPSALLVRLVIGVNVAWGVAALALALWLAPGALGLAYLAAHLLTVWLFAGLEQAGLRQSMLLPHPTQALVR